MLAVLKNSDPVHSPMNYNTRRFIIHRVKWLIAFMGIGSILVYLLPYPYDFISLASLFVLMVYIRNRTEIKRFGGMERNIMKLRVLIAVQK